MAAGHYEANLAMMDERKFPKRPFLRLHRYDGGIKSVSANPERKSMDHQHQIV
jgi:hypothetical protein